MRLQICLLLLIVSTCGCGHNSKREEPKPTPPIVVELPKPAILVYPDLNSVCVSGNVVSANESAVQLKWNAAANADAYEVTVKNLLTGNIFTQSTAQTQLTVTLIRNTPFSWFVTSKSSQTSVKTQSEIWKFYNAGTGLVTYAPFPADNLAPTAGQLVTASSSGTITLSWTGSDADNDINSYDIYLSTAANPALYKNNISSSMLTDVQVNSKTKYYWQVVTHDTKGNSSASDIISFITN